MEYKTETLRRMAQVLDSLKIKYVYRNEGYLFIKYEKIIILDKEVLVDVSSIDGMILNISREGKLVSNGGKNVDIVFCKNCRKVHILIYGEKNTLKCPKCGNHKELRFLLNRGFIPGWYGNNTKTLLDSTERRKKIVVLDELEGKNIDAAKNIINRLSGSTKIYRVTEEKISKIKSLKLKYPNMGEVIDYILDNLMTSRLRADKAVNFRPICLLGGPGCGKSSFASDISYILMGRKGLKIDIGNDISSFSLTGSDRSYNNAKHGLISEAMFGDEDGHPYGNPVIHFDEIDKINKESKYSPESVFYSILEKNTASRFYDSFIELNIDASGINYIFTANCLDNIPKPILNRMRIFKIEDYTHEQLSGFVLDSFYSNWIKSNNMMPECLPEKLSAEIREEILIKSHDDPRSIDDAISQVFAETLRYDEENHCSIALFSSNQLFNGWKKYCGKKQISVATWEIPDDFISLYKHDDTLEMF